jgi:ribosome-binding factor A
MAPSKHRPERVGTLIQQALAEALASQIKDPRLGFATVTGVIVSPDITHAEVHVSVLGSDEEKATAMEGLASAAGFLRTHVARSLSLRTTPELHFVLDRGLEHAQRIDRILHELKDEREP